MHTPFKETVKYLFLCFVSLELMHLFIRGSLNFTYLPIAALVLSVLYGVEIMKPFKDPLFKNKEEKNITAEKRTL